MRHRLLLADDSITIQKIVGLTFVGEEIDVVTVGNGELAVNKLATVNPDIVLADIFMPGKNGYEVCEYIKTNPQFCHIPVLLIVGAFEPFDKNEAARVKADAHLSKPFETGILISTVKRLLEKSLAQIVISDKQKLPSLEIVETDFKNEGETKILGSNFVRIEKITDTVHLPNSTTQLPELPLITATLTSETLPFQSLEENNIGKDKSLSSMDIVSTTQSEYIEHAVAQNEVLEIKTSKLAVNSDSNEGTSVISIIPVEKELQHNSFITDQIDSYSGFILSEGDVANPKIPLQSDLISELQKLSNEVKEQELSAKTKRDEVTVFEIPVEQKKESIDMEFMPIELAADTAKYKYSQAESLKETASYKEDRSYISEAEINEIVSRVVTMMSDKVVREIAWEVVPELAELLIKKQLETNNDIKKDFGYKV